MGINSINYPCLDEVVVFQHIAFHLNSLKAVVLWCSGGGHIPSCYTLWMQNKTGHMISWALTPRKDQPTWHRRKWTTSPLPWNSFLRDHVAMDAPWSRTGLVRKERGLLVWTQLFYYSANSQLAQWLAGKGRACFVVLVAVCLFVCLWCLKKRSGFRALLWVRRGGEGVLHRLDAACPSPPLLGFPWPLLLSAPLLLIMQSLCSAALFLFILIFVLFLLLFVAVPNP